MPGESNQVCKAHSGLVEKVSSLEKNITQLWSKWDSMQKMIIATLIGVIANLLIVILKIFGV